MDYDENEFHAKNLHLAGEGTNKIPVIPPYAIPKYEFDDSLQGSLRFDTLESDTFLGIGSNEDSQWIEEYSRGESGIHFGADTSKSCSITRQSNVWSEATSSESVEMLLKSVVQEDILRLQSENKVSDSCDELGCMIKQMESNSKRNSDSSFLRNAAQSSLSAHVLQQEDVGSKDSEHGIDTGIASVGELDDHGALSSILPAIPVDNNSNPGYVVSNECINDTDVNEQMHKSEPENKGSTFEMRFETSEAKNLNVNSIIIEAGGGRMDHLLGKEASSQKFTLNTDSAVVSVLKTVEGVNVPVSINTSQKKDEIVSPVVLVKDDSENVSPKVSFVGLNDKLKEFYSAADKSNVSDHTSFSNAIDVIPSYAYSPTSSKRIEVADKSNSVQRKGTDGNDNYSSSKNTQALVLSTSISPNTVPDDTDITRDIPEEIKTDFVPVASTVVGEKLSSVSADVENYTVGAKSDVPKNIPCSTCTSPVSTQSTSPDNDDPQILVNLAKEVTESVKKMSSSEVSKQSFVPSEAGDESGNGNVKLHDEVHMSSKQDEPPIDLAEEAKNVCISESRGPEIGVSLDTGEIGENETNSFDVSTHIPATDGNEKEKCPESVEINPRVDCEESDNVSDNNNANSSAHSAPLSKGDDIEAEPPNNAGTVPLPCKVEEKAHAKEQVSFSPILASPKVVEEQTPSSELRHGEDQSQVMLRRNVKLFGNSERKSKRLYNKVPKKETVKKMNSSKDTSRLTSTEKTQYISSNMAESSPQIPQSAGVFQQPFTDIQQVQLRAQIFVYGSLIQGIAPDESYMISAFGGPDGGKNLWESSWRLCYQRSKLLLSTPETPLHSRAAGSRPSDQMTKDLKLSSTSQPNIKSAPFLTPMLPFSSPLWTPDPLQSGGLPKTPAEFHRSWSPLPSQSTHTRSMNSQHPSWLTQSPLCGGPWVTPPSTSILDASTRLLSSKLAYEVPHIHRESDSSPQVPPASKQITPIPASLMEFSSIIVAEASVPKDATNFAPCSQPLAETKSRKRKKSVPDSTVNRAKESGDLLTMPVAHTISPEYNAEKPVALSSSSPALSKANHVEANKNLLSEEALEKVKESKAYAEEAASIATAAVNHSLELNSLIEKQNTSRSSPDNDFILASAIGAITAAASVAKAAAAAASLASNAALQAKLMAEEALVKTSPIVASVFNDGIKKASPASILKADNNSIAILGAARETARRRVEAASAASKRAENMDAIVKAAELAAEAVSQAGKIVAMGDHLPVSELISTSMKSHVREKKTLDSNEDLIGDNVRLIDVIATKSNVAKEKRKLSDFLDASQAEVENGDNNCIKEGSLVEVYKEGGGLKGAWFSGNVVGLNDGKALVCYSDLMLGEEKLKEWVDLRTNGHNAPKIRLSRPMSSFPMGTRKRRRSAYGDKKWNIGDKVDAWIEDCWSEGVISDKRSQGDDFIYTVHFPVSGETGDVKSWDLRPTLTWKDGQWSEKTNLPSKGDSPIEKKARFDLEKSFEPEPTLSQLTTNDRVFNMGKGSTGPLRMTRTGSQKESSNVVFGVPKPGKKRKFIEVSKHYVANQTSKPPPSRGLKTTSKPSLLPKPKPPKHPTAFGRSAADSSSKRHVDGEFVFSSQPKESSGRPKGSMEETGGSSNAGEPRRSNRRIQPTSRLLEGLQTSLMVSKLPSAAYDKSGKSKSKYEK